MSLRHSDLAGVWESAGSERSGHVPGSERYHFPVAGTFWREERGDAAAPGLIARRYDLVEEGFRVGTGSDAEIFVAWIEAGFLILRGDDEHETWCRRVV